MKIFVSVDMEGVAGIVDWAQCVASGEDYALGRDLLVGEVNAAITGALAAGATEIVVNDAHSVMRNLPPERIAGRAAYLSGRFKPLYMMQGLDERFDAILFVGYHAAMATPGVLSHTYNPRAIADVRLNGVTTGEAGLNALVAQHFGVPVAVVTGDQHVGPEAAPFCPGISAIEVKESVSRFSALNRHPEDARTLIEQGVRDALGRLDDLSPPEIAMPGTVEIRFLSPDMAEQATWIKGVRRIDSVTVELTGDEPLELYRSFIAIVYLTRSLVEN